jgi:hypothetical protein
MNEQFKEIEGTQDALLFLDCCAKFGYAGVGPNYCGQIADVIRTLMRRLEDQAAAFERAEALRQ